MAYVFGYNLTPHSERILETLMVYRAMTAKQLTAMLSAPYSPSLSEEKSVYNYLRKLKKQGLVASHKLQANVANGSLYYLTRNGYEQAMDILNIDEGTTGEGWIQYFRGFDELHLGSLPYEIYTPPLKQPAHHLLLIDFFIQLNMIDEDSHEMIKHRINLYAAKTYEVNGKKYRYRPDAEIILGGKHFAIEIDRSTESHEQLLQKFETYQQYLDYCSLNNVQKIDGIIFIVENKRREHGMKRRWTNILSAYFKRLQKYQDDLNLIMTPLDTARDTLLFELNRNTLEEKVREEMLKLLTNKGDSKVNRWYNPQTGDSTYSRTINNDKYQIFFNAASQGFESRIYTRYLEFLKYRLPAAKETEEVKDLNYKGYGKFIFYNYFKPYFVENLAVYNVDPLIIKNLEGLQKDIHFRSFYDHLNFSIYE